MKTRKIDEIDEKSKLLDENWLMDDGLGPYNDGITQIDNDGCGGWPNQVCICTKTHKIDDIP